MECTKLPYCLVYDYQSKIKENVKIIIYSDAMVLWKKQKKMLML